MMTRRSSRPELAGGLDAIQLGHPDVHEDHVQAQQRRRLLDGLQAGPAAGAAGSNPRPWSVTWIDNPSGANASTARAEPVAACLTTFVRDSCTIRYAASSRSG